jgi:Spy/CpxP family protein refolding chaperone
MKTIETVRGFGIAAVLTLAAAAAQGCTQSTTSSGAADPSPGAAQLTQADRGGPADHEMHGPPGPEMLLATALHHLDLTPDQRTTIENAAHAVGPAMPHDPSLFHEVAEGVRSGKLDEAAVLAKLDAASPPADRSAALVNAIDTLHKALAPEQRRALVDTIAKHIDEHEHAPAATGSGPPGLLGHLLSGLNLTDDQRQSIDRILASQAAPGEQTAMVARMQALHADLRERLQAFSGDRFDAAAFLTPWNNASPVNLREHVQHTLHALAAIVPVLDPAQRATLAAAIEAGPQHAR